MRLAHAFFDSPLGRLLLVAGDGCLVGLELPVERHPIAWESRRRPSPVLDRAARQLEDYFAGRSTTFDLPLDPRGTEFQRSTWRALLDIPFAVTWSYGQLARVVGRPRASRAVGAANGRNPIAIVIPCHRVIGSDGSLTGYGGGVRAKRWLLEHEVRVAGRGQAELFSRFPVADQVKLEPLDPSRGVTVAGAASSGSTIPRPGSSR
jgi:methylated-DNA-[protein]-cysteine S-methyltransferase